jgi:hypothetical protein
MASPQPTPNLASDLQQELLFLFSSVPPDRPNYKRGVLDALCYPSGHILEVSYKHGYVQPSLAADLRNLVGKQVVFVFVDYKDTDHIFIPVRYATILSCEPKEPSKKISDSTRIYIRIELGELIRLNSQWDEWIKKLPNRPRPLKGQPRDYYFVIQGRVPADSSAEYSQADIWDELVQRISGANVLSDCIFLATGGLQEFTDATDCSFARFGNDRKAYRLRPNHLYKMELRIFDRRNKPDTNQEIYIRTSSDLIVVSQPFATAIGGPVEHTILIVCKRSIEDILATLVMDVRDAGSSETDSESAASDKKVVAGSKEGNAVSAVICAKPRYLLHVSVPWKILLWFVVFVFAGVLFTSTSVEFFKDREISELLSWLPSTPPVWALAAKIVGAACLSAAAYLGFRKLPSGSPGG